MSYLREKRRRHGMEPYSKPNIISFADVVLVLLVIFLVSMSAAVQVVQLNLPQAVNTAGRDANLAVSLSVTKDGQYYYEDVKTPIKGKDLWTFLRETKGGNSWTVALLRADKDTLAQHVALAAQCLQGLGVDEISFVMSEKELKPEPQEQVQASPQAE